MHWLKAFTFAFAVTFSLLSIGGNSARILGFFPSPSSSHLMIHCAEADALAHAGHNVTVIATKPNVYPNAKYHYIHIDTPMLPDSFMHQLVNDPEPFYVRYSLLLKESAAMANRTLWHPRVQQFLSEHIEGSFDLLLLGYFGNDFQLGLGVHFKCPVIISFMVQPVFSLNKIIGNPSEHAYVPSLFSGLKQPMDFWARLQSYLIYLFEYYYIDEVLESLSQKYYSFNFPSARGYANLDEARHNVALLFVNHWFAQGPIRSNVPGVIEIGGIQIKEQPDPLPADISRILDNSSEGVIYFSLGSHIQGDLLPTHKAQIMYNVLSKLPHKVLWKWSETYYPGNASNIIYKSWLPQNDVLAHPNVKLFITHGGQGSVVESWYHGVPMVGIPLFGDQPMNIENVVRRGFGLSVNYANLKEEPLYAAIEKVLQDPKYTNAVRKFSHLYRDRQMTPQQTVVWWANYVLRHKGARHMQSPAVYLTHWQLMSLDVFGALLAFMVIVVGLLVAVGRLCTAMILKGLGKRKKNAANEVKKTVKVD